MNAIVIYKTKEGYGYRPHEFDWRTGDRIMSKDGKTMQRIVRVVGACKEVVEYLNKTMQKCKKYSGEGFSRLCKVDGQLVIKTTVFEDGTGEDYFMKCIARIPEYTF